MARRCGGGGSTALSRAIVGVALALAAVAAGCAASLPYRPERQPFGGTISAGIRVVDERLRVEIDSEGYRVERAVLVRDGDQEVAPEALVPAAAAAPGGGVSIGFGVGTGGWGSGGSYTVGTGIDLGGPLPTGTTLAVFRLDAAGPPPWRLRVKVVGVDAVDIVLDPTASGRP